MRQMQIVKMLTFLFVMYLCCKSVFAVELFWYQHKFHQYYVERMSFVRNYDEAVSSCHDKNSILAMVKTKELQSFLAEKIGNLTNEPYSLYIGLKYNNISRKFEWTDGTSLSPDDALWQKGEPNKLEDEHCVTMGWIYQPIKNYSWFNIPCIGNNRVSTSRYICQRSVVLLSTTISTYNIISEEEFIKSTSRLSTLDNNTNTSKSTIPQTTSYTKIELTTVDDITLNNQNKRNHKDAKLEENLVKPIALKSFHIILIIIAAVVVLVFIMLIVTAIFKKSTNRRSTTGRAVFTTEHITLSQDNNRNDSSLL